MKRSRRISYAALAGYLLFMALGLALVIGMMVMVAGASGGDGDNDLGEGLTVAIGIILAFLGGIYTLVGVIPATLKGLAIRRENRLFTVFCLPFDTVYILFHSAMLVSSVTSDGFEPISAVIFALLLTVSLAILTLNIITLSLASGLSPESVQRSTR